jgi:ADP-heptose:LPS heptosyltransferase
MPGSIIRKISKQFIIALLARQPRQPVPSPRTIRIFRYGGIGDLVALTGLLQALFRWNPNIHITLVTRPGMGSIFEHLDLPLTIITMKAPTDKMGLVEAVKFRQQLNQSPHDIDLFLHNDVKSLLFARSLKSSCMFGFDSDEQGYGRLFDASFSVYGRKYESPERRLRVMHVNELFHRAADATLGIQLERQPVRLLSTLKERQQFCEKLLVKRRPVNVALLPCGTEHIKMWPTQNYVQLAKRIEQELNASVLIIGGTQERSKEPAFAGLDNVFFCAGNLTLRESFAALAECAVVVGNDTGMLHAAVALDCATVGLFGPTESGAFGYEGIRNVVLKSTRKCIPCHMGACELRRGETSWRNQSGLCLEDLTVDQVFNSVMNLLLLTLRAK